MTRTTVLELCAETNLDYELTDIPANTLVDSDEVFLSSTAGGVIPITKVDDEAIGDGSPGPVTMRLRELYWTKREAGWHATPADYGEQAREVSAAE